MERKEGKVKGGWSFKKDLEKAINNDEENRSVPHISL